MLLSPIPAGEMAGNFEYNSVKRIMYFVHSCSMRTIVLIRCRGSIDHHSIDIYFFVSNIILQPPWAMIVCHAPKIGWQAPGNRGCLGAAAPLNIV